MKPKVISPKKAFAHAVLAGMAISPTLTVSVTYSDGFYTAVCDDLHLVTEAETIDALRDRVWELAPDLVALNELPIDADSMLLCFDMEPSAPRQMTM